jgi:hypothetical protein
MDSETAIATTPANGADCSDYDAIPLQADGIQCFDECVEGDYGDSGSDADDILESASFSLSSVVSHSTSNFRLR